MLNIVTFGNRFFRSAFCIGLLSALACCDSGKVDEETLSLYMNNKKYDALVFTLQAYSSKRDYRVTQELLPGANPENSSRHIMLEGRGIRVLLQSALLEQCKEREGRRDVGYSNRIFEVNAFSTSYLKSNSDLLGQVKQLKDVPTNSGFRVISRSESCSLL